MSPDHPPSSSQRNPEDETVNGFRRNERKSAGSRCDHMNDEMSMVDLPAAHPAGISHCRPECAEVGQEPSFKRGAGKRAVEHY